MVAARQNTSVNERDSSGTVRLQGTEMKKVENFKLPRVNSPEQWKVWKEVKKHAEAGWDGWRKESCVMSDKRRPAGMKGKESRCSGWG